MMVEVPHAETIVCDPRAPRFVGPTNRRYLRVEFKPRGDRDGEPTTYSSTSIGLDLILPSVVTDSLSNVGDCKTNSSSVDPVHG